MNKKQFDKISASLYKRGYKKYDQHWHHEDYILGKGFHRWDNQWEEDRNAYQILMSVYDYSNKDYPGLRPQDRDHVGIEVRVGVSRTSDERVELVLAWHDDDAIENIEGVAESFYEFVCETWPEPREEEPKYR